MLSFIIIIIKRENLLLNANNFTTENISFLASKFKENWPKIVWQTTWQRVCLCVWPSELKPKKKHYFIWWFPCDLLHILIEYPKLNICKWKLISRAQPNRWILWKVLLRSLSFNVFVVSRLHLVWMQFVDMCSCFESFGIFFLGFCICVCVCYSTI